MVTIQKVFLLAASFSGAMAVMLGAMGAHMLKDKLNYWEMNSFQTGVTYQMYHTLALLALVIVYNYVPSRLIEFSGYSFIFGMALFSGSLYLLSMKSIFLLGNASVLGPITPVGGLALIAGWLLLAAAVLLNWK
jgi:uncharacterized membrane protein YgdD (TMEM256/DUF423 family)